MRFLLDFQVGTIYAHTSSQREKKATLGVLTTDKEIKNF